MHRNVSNNPTTHTHAPNVASVVNVILSYLSSEYFGVTTGSARSSVRSTLAVRAGTTHNNDNKGDTTIVPPRSGNATELEDEVEGLVIVISRAKPN